MMKCMGQTCMGSLDSGVGGWQPVEGIHQFRCRPITNWEVEHTPNSSRSSNPSSTSRGTVISTLPSFFHTVLTASSLFSLSVLQATHWSARCWLLIFQLCTRAENLCFFVCTFSGTGGSTDQVTGDFPCRPLQSDILGRRQLPLVKCPDVSQSP